MPQFSERKEPSSSLLNEDVNLKQLNLRLLLLFLLPICRTQNCQLQNLFWIITKKRGHFLTNSLIIPHKHLLKLLITRNHLISV